MNINDKLLALSLPDKSVIKTPPGFFPSGPGGLEDIIQWVLRILFILAITLAMLYLIWGGVKWIISGGDKEQIASARRIILFAIVGLVVVILAVVIVHVVGTFLGVDIFYLSSPDSTGGPCVGNNCLIE